MARKKTTRKAVETLTHEQATRKNIPTAEYQSVMQKEEQEPIRVAYERPVAGLTDEKNQRARDLDPQLVWRGKDQQDWSDLVVHAPPLYIQEKVHPKVLIDDLLRRTAADRQQDEPQVDLFADFNGLTQDAARTEFYQHDANWTNRMILGDSLQVMASLAEREGLRGQVQCIYIDPPYGIKFNSNFQWSTTSRDVKDGKVDHITREPEQVKAFRDTWRDGIHSYLTYLRDRLTVARDLLTDSGSIFVQIGDENVHHVRAVMEEVFGVDNFIAQISTKTSGGSTGVYLSGVTDYVLWFARDQAGAKYRALFGSKELGEAGAEKYNRLRLTNLERRSLTRNERKLEAALPNGARVYRQDNLTSQSIGRDKGEGAASWFPVKIESKEVRPSLKVRWKTNEAGMDRLLFADRVELTGNSLAYVRYLDDFIATTINNAWIDIGGIQSRADPKVYVVQTPTTLTERCLLMATDPGDLVLDPTCGSGTTAYVAEQWGRRWITIDTSRVALALARARIMGARYPYYLLADSPEGQRKEAELSGRCSVVSGQSDHKAAATGHRSQTTGHWSPTPGHYSPTTGHCSLRQGFVYQRVPHITLKSIANNAEIDVIWERWQGSIAPLLAQLSAVVGDEWLVARRKKSGHESPATSHSLAEWEVPRKLPDDWLPEAKPLHEQFWQARVARQRDIDASIAAKADHEFLYDKPYEDKKTVRVAGPFTVESLSPHRVLGVDEDDELIDWVADGQGSMAEEQNFTQMILENLKTAGVQQAHKDDKIDFLSLTPWAGDLVCAEGRCEVASDQWLVARDQKPTTGHQPLTTQIRAAIFIGPEFGTVSRPDLVAAAREAGEADFDVLVACAFSYDAHSADFNKLGRIPVLKARMNADLHMADDLKNTGKGNLFVIFGEPDVDVVSGLWLVTSGARMVENYERVKELSGIDSLAEINRLGGNDLSGFKELSSRGTLRTDESDPPGSGVRSVQHRGGSGTGWDEGISTVSQRRERIAGGSGDPTDSGEQVGLSGGGGSGIAAGTDRGDRSHARRTKTLAAIQSLKPTDFPLTLTTSHYSQVTIHGVDVFHPQTGEVRSDGAEGIACWFIDTDYNEESFFVRHAYFLGANDPYKALKTTLKAEINEDAWATLHSDISRPFDRPESGRIAVKVINHLGDEVMKVFRV